VNDVNEFTKQVQGLLISITRRIDYNSIDWLFSYSFFSWKSLAMCCFAIDTPTAMATRQLLSVCLLNIYIRHAYMHTHIYMYISWYV
jgi:hypothetical protein